MSESAPVASKGPGASLVELECELDALLVEYEFLSRAWPKGPDILTRAKIGRRVEDALSHILSLHHAIATAQAKTLLEVDIGACDAKPIHQHAVDQHAHLLMARAGRKFGDSGSKIGQGCQPRLSG